MRFRLLPYVAVVSARYRMLLQYRAAAFAGLVTQLFWGAIRLMILAAFYAASTTSQPMTMADIVAYVWLGQALLGLLPWNIDPDFTLKVRDGSVAYELLRPLDLYTFLFARTLAFRTATTTLRAIPMVVFAMVLLPLAGLEPWAMHAPPSAGALGLFLASITLAAGLATAVTMVSQISLLWTISAAGVDRLIPALVTIGSGMVVPLPLFPIWLQPWLYWQPFRGLADVPFRIYSGNIPAAAATLELLQQLLWLLLVIWLGRSLLARGIRKLVFQGG